MSSRVIRIAAGAGIVALALSGCGLVSDGERVASMIGDDAAASAGVRSAIAELRTLPGVQDAGGAWQAAGDAQAEADLTVVFASGITDGEVASVADLVAATLEPIAANGAVVSSQFVLDDSTWVNEGASVAADALRYWTQVVERLPLPVEANAGPEFASLTLGSSSSPADGLAAVSDLVELPMPSGVVVGSPTLRLYEQPSPALAKFVQDAPSNSGDTALQWGGAQAPGSAILLGPPADLAAVEDLVTRAARLPGFALSVAAPGAADRDGATIGWATVGDCGRTTPTSADDEFVASIAAFSPKLAARVLPGRCGV